MAGKKVCVCDKGEEIGDMHGKIKTIHKLMLGGDGQPGMLQDFNQFKGGLKVAKYVGGSGGLVALFALILSIISILSRGG